MRYLLIHFFCALSCMIFASQNKNDDLFENYLGRTMAVYQATSNSLFALPPSEQRTELNTTITAMTLIGISLAHEGVCKEGKIALRAQAVDTILEHIYVNLTAGILDEKSHEVEDPSEYTQEQKAVLIERMHLLAKTLVLPKPDMKIESWIDDNMKVIQALPYQIHEKDGSFSVERKQSLTASEEKIRPIPGLREGL